MSLPNKLYKYRHLNTYTIQTIVNSVVCFTMPDSLNDPFDCRLRPTSYEGTDEEYRAYFTNLWKHKPDEPTDVARRVDEVIITKQAHRDSKYMDERWDEVQGSVNKRRGVFCLAADPANILMWSHYGDSHRGCCLEFSTNASVFKAARKVDYPTSYPNHRFLDFVGNDERLLNLTIFTKANLWEYEKEWRVLDAGKGAGLYSFEQDALTGIIFGYLMPLEQKMLLHKLVKNRNPPVQLYQATPWKHEFKMQILPLPST